MMRNVSLIRTMTIGTVATALAATAIFAQPAVGKVDSALPVAPATVTVDFARSRGAFLHPERYNNLSRAARWVEQRDSDVQFFNENGLHGNTYRVWVDTQLIHDKKTGAYNYDGITDYLADASRLSDDLLVVLDTRVQVRDDKATPAQLKPIIKTITLELKKRFPQIRYIEAFNEPDHNLAKVITPTELYDYYMVYYQVVNEVNRELNPKVSLRVGGPALMMYHEAWLKAFLDRYKADLAPDKRLDFVSWHEYGEFPAGTGDTSGPRAYHFYKGDPSEVAGHRVKFNEELRRRGLDVKMPSFLTETGIYPGPSFDDAKNPLPDYSIGAAGVPSLHYWLMESANSYPFNWVLRHSTEERKDQLVTRAGADRKTPLTRTFTPYGNAMAMMALLKNERVVALSNALVSGKGVYAIATKGATGVAVMVWNYQHTENKAYRVNIDMGLLPADLRRKNLRQRLYRIDDKLSNYWADPATANLQQVSDMTVKAAPRQSVVVDLPPNALELIVLEPAGAK